MPFKSDNNNRNVMFGITTVIVAVAVAALVWFSTAQKSDTAQNNSGMEPAIATGDTQIGNGDYALTDVNGQTVTQDSFPGKFKLVFFGFTNCPDECPAALQKISTTLTALGDDANRLQTLFITVDPARDTQAQLRGYLSNFNPAILGLTGSSEQIKQASDVFRAYYSPEAAVTPVTAAPTANTSKDKMAMTDGASHADMADHAMVEHSAYIYLLSPSNELITVLEPARGADDMAQTIRAAFNSTPAGAMSDSRTPAATLNNAPSDQNSLSTDVPEETPPVSTTPAAK